MTIVSDHFETNDPELLELISWLDSGIDPEGILVIRERNWPRAMAAGIAFVVSAAIPLLIIPLGPKGMKGLPFGLLVVLLAVSVIVACLGIWLLQLFLQGHTFYAAMNDRFFILRRGPNWCKIIPCEEMVTFHIKNGVLSVELESSDVKITVIKDAYSRESLKTVKDRLKSWRNSPHEIRNEEMQNLNTEEYLRHKKNAIRLISTGIFGALLLVFLIILNFQRQNLLAAFIIPFQVFACLMSVSTTLAGVFLLGTARMKKPNSNRDDFEIE